MKNCYFNRVAVDNSNAFVPMSSNVVTVDVESTELFEKLNPVLSNGHRANIITRLVDKNVPREVADVISQLVSTVPHDSSNKGFTDEQIKQMIVSRGYENEIELDIVRKELEDVIGDMFPDAASTDVGSTDSASPGADSASTDSKPE